MSNIHFTAHIYYESKSVRCMDCIHCNNFGIFVFLVGKNSVEL